MTRNRPTARRGEAPGRTKEAAMYMHELLIRARQDELLRAAAQHRLAADVRRARPSVAVRVAGRAGRHRSPLRTGWAGARPAVGAGLGALVRGDGPRTAGPWRSSAP